MSYNYYIDDFSRPLGDSFWSKHHWFKSCKVYNAYKNYIGNEIAKKDFEESFTGQFLKAGFKVYRSSFCGEGKNIGFNWHKDESFNPKLNWFGVSTYSPDRMFIKDNKIIIMSLQGNFVPYNPMYDNLFKDMAIRYIKIMVSDKVLYENWTGELPPKDLINDFIK